MTAVVLASPDGGVPLSRLVRVELRKTVDTWAGRWLLVVIGPSPLRRSPPSGS